MSTQPTIFVTGGASGIGLAIAKAIVERGWQVVIAAMTAGAALTGAVAGITLAVVKLVG